jgi:hypothetical protein
MGCCASTIVVHPADAALAHRTPIPAHSDFRTDTSAVPAMPPLFSSSPPLALQHAGARKLHAPSERVRRRRRNGPPDVHIPSPPPSLHHLPHSGENTPTSADNANSGGNSAAASADAEAEAAAAGTAASGSSSGGDGNDNYSEVSLPFHPPSDVHTGSGGSTSSTRLSRSSALTDLFAADAAWPGSGVASDELQAALELSKHLIGSPRTLLLRGIAMVHNRLNEPESSRAHFDDDFRVHGMSSAQVEHVLGVLEVGLRKADDVNSRRAMAGANKPSRVRRMQRVQETDSSSERDAETAPGAADIAGATGSANPDIGAGSSATGNVNINPGDSDPSPSVASHTVANGAAASESGSNIAAGLLFAHMIERQNLDDADGDNHSQASDWSDNGEDLPHELLATAAKLAGSLYSYFPFRRFSVSTALKYYDRALTYQGSRWSDPLLWANTHLQIVLLHLKNSNLPSLESLIRPNQETASPMSFAAAREVDSGADSIISADEPHASAVKTLKMALWHVDEALRVFDLNSTPAPYRAACMAKCTAHSRWGEILARQNDSLLNSQHEMHLWQHDMSIVHARASSDGQPIGMSLVNGQWVSADGLYMFVNDRWIERYLIGDSLTGNQPSFAISEASGLTLIVVTTS